MRYFLITTLACALVGVILIAFALLFLLGAGLLSYEIFETSDEVLKYILVGWGVVTAVLMFDYQYGKSN